MVRLLDKTLILNAEQDLTQYYKLKFNLLDLKGFENIS